MNSEPIIRFESVSLGYGRTTVLSNLEFTIPRGDFLGIVGPNGVGKTTILRGILGLLRPLRGSIRYMGNQPRHAIHFGYVPQQETLDDRYPLTVQEVVLMGRYRRVGLFKRPGERDLWSAAEAIETAGITAGAVTLFRELSGGQRQRALLARALASEPDLLILDEPTSGLDLSGTASIMNLLERLHATRGFTIVMVSHQLNTVARWVKNAALLHDGILDMGPRDQIFSTETLSRVYGSGAKVLTVDDDLVILPPDTRA